MPLLVRHPDAPPGAIHTVEAEVRRIDGGAVATFRAVGDISRLVVPPPAPSVRTDDLWQTTCFELFVGGEGGGYREFNLSPSGAWAAYSFGGHRSGRRNVAAAIEIETSSNKKILTLVAKIKPDFPDPVFVGPTAVICETDAVTRYWATAFAPGVPDFHAEVTRSLLFDGVSAE